MPIYEYQCQGKCKKVFEYMQSMKDPPMKKCEKCGGKLDRIISAAGFVLKGGGWYKDLYASSKPGSGGGDSDGGGESVSAATPATTTSTTSESKPAKVEKAEPKKTPAKKKSSKGK